MVLKRDTSVPFSLSLSYLLISKLDLTGPIRIRIVDFIIGNWEVDVWMLISVLHATRIL